MRDDVTMQRRLSLAGRIHKMNYEQVYSITYLLIYSSWANQVLCIIWLGTL